MVSIDGFEQLNAEAFELVSTDRTQRRFADHGEDSD